MESSAAILKCPNALSSTYFLFAASKSLVGVPSKVILLLLTATSPAASKIISLPDSNLGTPELELCIVFASTIFAVTVPLLVKLPTVPVILRFCTDKVFVPLFQDKPLDVFTSVVPVEE